MDKVLTNIIQEMDSLLKSKNRETGVSDGTGTCGTYTLDGKNVRIDVSDGHVILFDVLAPGTEFPYKTWRNQDKTAEIAKTAVRLLDTDN